MSIVCIDPGHGMGNRAPGVYDPGIVGVNNVEEARLAMNYALCLQSKLVALGVGTVLTRRDNEEPSSLARRIQLAKQAAADFFLSIHFNGDANPSNSPADGKNKGFQVLYRAGSDPKSLAFANALVSAMTPRIVARGAQPIDRQDLYVLHYRPSCLIEWGFLDDPEDAALLLSENWMNDACQGVALAIHSVLGDAKS